MRGAGVEGCCCSFCCSCESLGLDDSGDGGVDAEFDAFAELEGFGAFIAAAHGRIEARWEADAGTCAVSGSQGGKASSCTQKAMSFFFFSLSSSVVVDQKLSFFLSSIASYFLRDEGTFSRLTFSIFLSPMCPRVSTRSSQGQSLGLNDRRKKPAREIEG